MESGREKQEDRLCECVSALEWDIGHRVCVFLVASSVCEKRNGRYKTGTERHEWGKVREQSGRNWERRGGGWEGRRRGRELAQMRLALTQQDILSHTLHMSSPILSQNQHWSYSVESMAHTSDWWNYWYFMAVVQSKPETTNVIQSLSATELFQGFNIRAYPHNRVRGWHVIEGGNLVGKKRPEFQNSNKKRIFHPFV